MRAVRRLRVFVFALALPALPVPASWAARPDVARPDAGRPAPARPAAPRVESTVVLTVTAGADVTIRPAGTLRVRTGQRVKFLLATRTADVVPVVTVDGAAVPLAESRNRWLFTLAADAPHAVVVVGKPRAVLHVTKAGAGTGRVTSDPHGLDCGTHCAAVFADGAQVALNATCDDPFVFRGWSGACSGTDPHCALTLAASSTPTEAVATCDVPPPPAVCGNGVLEAGEQCDGQLGCPDTAYCATDCTCVDLPHARVSSESLIAAALANGTIDYPTSLLYRAWALFADSRLPPEYDGEVTAGEDGLLFTEIGTVLPTLAPEQAAQLAPFVARPTEPASYFNAQPGRRPAASDPCPNDWRPTETNHFVVWACGHNAPTDDTAPQRATMASIVERLWSTMQPALGDLKGDSFRYGPAPTNRIDIYLTEFDHCRIRGGDCIEVERDKELGLTVPAENCDASPVGTATTSAYLVFPLRDVATPVAGLEGTVAHELYHAFQFANNASANAVVCSSSHVTTRGSRSWLTESTAEWAAWVFAPDSDPAQRADEFLFFQRGLPPGVVRLDSVEGQRPYESFVYHTFVQQEAGGPAAGFDLWKGSAGVNSVAAFTARFRRLFPWDTWFREFAVRNLNPLPGDFSPGNPVTPVYADLDPVLRRGIEPLYTVDRVQLIAGLDVQDSITVVPLAARYDRYDANAVRYVKLDFSRVANAESLDLDVIKKVDGIWHREKVRGPVYEFCRDEEDVTEFALVESNHTELAGALLDGTYHLTALDHCPDRWTGTIDYRCTLDKSYTRSDPFLTETGEDHRDEYQVWSVVSSGSESPVPGAPASDVLKTLWQAHLKHDGFTTDAYSPRCNGGEQVSEQHGLAGGSSDVDKIFIQWAGTNIYLAPAPDFPGRSRQVVSTSDVTYCDGSLFETAYTDAAIDALLLVVTQPGELVEDPPGSGRYHGSLVQLDDTQPIEGGQTTVKCVETWDLQHHPASP